MSTMTSTKVTLTALKACKGMSSWSAPKSDIIVTISAGHDGELYLTNSFALARADRFAAIWAASNLELKAGRYILNGHVNPDLEGATPDLARITEGLANDPEVFPFTLTGCAGRQLMVDIDGICLLFCADPHIVVVDRSLTAVKRQLVDVYLGDVATWRGAGPTKPVSAWDYDGRLIGCVMPVRIP